MQQLEPRNQTKPTGTPCLFNVRLDMGERHNIAGSHPSIVEQMLRRLKELSTDFWQATKLPDNGRFCQAMQERDGYVGPWLPVDSAQ